MAVQSRFHNDRDGAAMAKLPERDGIVDPAAPEEMKPLLRRMAQRINELSDKPGQRSMEESVAGGGSLDDVEVLASKFKNKIPTWSNSYAKKRINP